MDVQITAEDVAGDIRWTIDGKHPKQSVIDLPPKSGKHSLDFHLIDRTGRSLRFAPDPIWLHETDSGACPPQGISSDQIAVISVNPKKLSITNENTGNARTLQYRLNFEDRDGALLDLDPVIRNGGGGN